MAAYNDPMPSVSKIPDAPDTRNAIYDGHNVDKVQRAVPKYLNTLIGPGAAKEKAANDPVNSPSHYTYGGIETIDFIEAKKLGFNAGNAVKYITRAGKKNPNGCIWTDFQRDTFAKQDLEKAVWYLQREIKNLKTKLE